MNKVNSIADYISQFEEGVQHKLNEIYQLIKKEAPEASEGIFYAMPGFKLNGPLIYFAATKHHIGLYPLPETIKEFELELSNYACTKGAVRFPLNKPLPLDLISTIVQFRIAVNLAKKKTKSKES